MCCVCGDNSKDNTEDNANCRRNDARHQVSLARLFLAIAHIHCSENNSDNREQHAQNNNTNICFISFNRLRILIHIRILLGSAIILLNIIVRLLGNLLGISCLRAAVRANNSLIVNLFTA